MSAWASITTMSLAWAGMGVFMAQRPATASSYRLPAERGEAAMAVRVNQGWFSIRVTKRWPTMPVAPMIPTLYCFISDYLHTRS